MIIAFSNPNPPISWRDHGGNFIVHKDGWEAPRVCVYLHAKSGIGRFSDTATGNSVFLKNPSVRFEPISWYEAGELK